MNDLVTRILLKNDDFDRSIKKSKEQVLNFDKGITAMKGGLLKVAGVFGVVMTAGEALNKVLNSSQALGDQLAATMEVGASAVDQFFYSLGSGDFSAFNNGLTGIIDRAKEAYTALDQLGNTRISYGYFASKYAGEIADAQTIAKNKFAPISDRQQAFAAWKGAIDAQQEANKTLQNDLINYITSAVTNKAGNSNLNISMADVERSLAIDIANPLKRDSLKATYGAQFEEYTKELAKYRAKYTTTQTVGSGMNVRAVQQVDTEKMNAATKELTQKYRDAIIVNTMLNKYTDEELTNIADNARQYQELNRSVAGLIREYNETANEFNNANKGVAAVQSYEGYKIYAGTNSASSTVPKTTKTAAPAAGSLDYINAQLASLQKQLNAATDNATRISIKQQMDRVSAQKKSIMLTIELGEPGGKQLEGGGIAKISVPNNSRDELLNGINIKPIDNSIIQSNANYADSIGEIGRVIGNVTALTNDGASAWLSYSANIISATASAIPAIVALTSAKKAEASANAESAVTGGMASVASIPIVGWVMAIGAAASLIAAMASIPKFAQGGIVPGNSFYGDKVPAMLNSGEMILNGVQQARLFYMLNNGNTWGNGEMKVTIDGDKLAVLIDRVNYKKRRVR